MANNSTRQAWAIADGTESGADLLLATLTGATANAGCLTVVLRGFAGVPVATAPDQFASLNAWDVSALASGFAAATDTVWLLIRLEPIPRRWATHRASGVRQPSQRHAHGHL